MSWMRLGRTVLVAAFTLAASAGLVVAGEPGDAARASGGHSGKASQSATTMQCGSPFGADSTYCDTLLSPSP
jgi:hypothetical protein